MPAPGRAAPRPHVSPAEDAAGPPRNRPTDAGPRIGVEAQAAPSLAVSRNRARKSRLAFRASATEAHALPLLSAEGNTRAHRVRARGFHEKPVTARKQERCDEAEEPCRG